MPNIDRVFWCVYAPSTLVSAAVSMCQVPSVNVFDSTGRKHGGLEGIFPLYLLCVLSYVVVRPAIPVDAMFTDGIPTWSYVLFVQNFFMGTAGHFGGVWLGGTWSLAIEEPFYLVLPG